jgi:hypothetical protein
MMKIVTRLAFAFAVFLALSSVSSANDPLLGGSSQPVVVGDQELAKVTGTGYYALYYGTNALYYMGNALYYYNYGLYYTMFGSSYQSTAGYYLYYAYVNLSYATGQAYSAYYCNYNCS